MVSHQAQNSKAKCTFTEQLLVLSVPGREGLCWAAVSRPGSGSPAEGWAGCCKTLALGTGTRSTASDMCLHNPQTCLVHKICLGLCWLNFL